ncbi:MAG TPA: hypothetical protein VK543_16770 [Puia sp.]|nr:hypothetical protein [Puia sp.]
MKPTKLFFAVFAISIICVYGFTPKHNNAPESRRPNTLFYRGHFTMDTDVIISVYTATSNGTTVVDGAFGINVGGPFYSATGTIRLLGQGVSDFHMVANGTTFDFTGDFDD